MLAWRVLAWPTREIGWASVVSGRFILRRTDLGAIIPWTIGPERRINMHLTRLALAALPARDDSIRELLAPDRDLA